MQISLTPDQQAWIKARVASGVIASAAAADARDILTFLSEQSGERTASKYAALFERLYDRLEVFPASGTPRPARVRTFV